MKAVLHQYVAPNGACMDFENDFYQHNAPNDARRCPADSPTSLCVTNIGVLRTDEGKLEIRI